MHLVSWNVNGMRSAIDKGLREFVEDTQPDVLCFQETRVDPSQLDLTWVDALGYQQYWNNAEKKGYSGTAIWSRPVPRKVSSGIGIAEHDREGRVLTASYDEFHLVNVYTPNAQRGLARIDYRQAWDAAFLTYVQGLKRRKAVIVCGDVNCAHHEIDLANPNSNRNNAGFSESERAALDRLQKAGFIDAYREFDPEPGKYTWWTQRTNARERNIGWRLDYFWVAQTYWERVQDATIRSEVYGSDHCPIELFLA